MSWKSYTVIEAYGNNLKKPGKKTRELQKSPLLCIIQENHNKGGGYDLWGTTNDAATVG